MRGSTVCICSIQLCRPIICLLEAHVNLTSPCLSLATVYGHTVTRRVCANFGYPGDCCTWTAEIDVRRCYSILLDTREDYYVYRLVYPPGCSIAYCAGRWHHCLCNQTGLVDTILLIVLLLLVTLVRSCMAG